MIRMMQPFWQLSSQGFARIESLSADLSTFSNRTSRAIDSILATYFPTLAYVIDVNVTHIGKRDGISHAKTISGVVERNDLLNDIGARVSDVLFGNCAVWVEEPSDCVAAGRAGASVPPPCLCFSALPCEC